MARYLLLGFTLGLSAAAIPGPWQAFLVNEALRGGWRRALPGTLAPLVTDGPIVILVVFALSRLPEALLRGLQLAGGLFLLYLAYAALRAFLARRQGLPEVQTAAGRTLAKAALTNLLSPGPYLFWGLVAGPILLRAWRGAALNGVGFLVAFYLALIGGMALLVLATSGARRLGPRVTHALTGVSALALLAFGLYQLGMGLFA